MESLKEYIDYLEEKKNFSVENKDELVKLINYTIAENTIIKGLLEDFEKDLKQHIFNIENVKTNKKVGDFL